MIDFAIKDVLNRRGTI